MTFNFYGIKKKTKKSIFWLVLFVYSRRPSLVQTLKAMFGIELIYSGIARLIGDLSTFSGPLLLQQVCS